MERLDPQVGLALAALPLPVLLLRADGRVGRANPACATRFDIAAGDWVGRPLEDLLHITDLPALLAAARGGEVVECEVRVQANTAQIRSGFPMQLCLRRLPAAAADAPGGAAAGDARADPHADPAAGGGDPDPVLLLSLQDLTRERHLERILMDAQSLAGVGSWHVDIHSGRSHLTPEAYRLYGIGEAESVDFDRFLRCVHPDDRTQLVTCWHRALAGYPYVVEHRVLAHGQLRWVEARGQLETDLAGRALRVIGSVLDITRHKQAEESIRQLIHYDTLTRLPNRNMARLQLERLLEAEASPLPAVGVLMLDLDHFKELNDSDGHEAGDEALVQVAATLQPLLRTEATLARVGGDEFMVVLPEAGIEDAVAVAERLLQALEQALQVAGRPFYARASIGVAASPEDGEAAFELIRHAEMAMREARSAGGHRYGLYRRQMSTAVQRRIRLATRLDLALRSGQLDLHYQPKVDLATRALVGVEALARWYDLELGWVSPAEFIALAEERGLIEPLGDWALARAARDYRRWSRRGPLPWRVAVNVSARQLAQGGFAERAEAVVREAGASPQDIELELTETAMAGDPQLARAMADRLAAAGFSLALDDFGTGYSSPAQLHRFPLHKLKIDMQFVQGALDQPGHQAIVRAVVGMAAAMGLDVVAEGIETAEQAACLRALGCTQGQGWLYGKPMSADDFAREWLRSGLALA